MRKFYPAKYLLLLSLFILVISELSAQRAGRRCAKKTYVCGMAASFMAMNDLTPTSVFVSGTVTNDQGHRLPFVSVNWKGKKSGLQTNEDGYFSIEKQRDDSVIEIATPGYVTQLSEWRDEVYMYRKFVMIRSIEIVCTSDYSEITKGLTGKLQCGSVSGSLKISGSVKDKEGNPIAFPSVLLKGTNTGIAGDENGAFSFPVKSLEKVELTVSAAGYKTASVRIGKEASEIRLETDTLSGEITITVPFCTIRTQKNEFLEQSDYLMEEVIVTAPSLIRCSRLKAWCSSYFDLCGFVTVDKAEDPAKVLTLYPNPARSGSSVTVEWKGLEGKFKWQLMDMLGKRIKTVETFFSEKYGAVKIQLPPIPPGAYIISFADEKGNQFAKKIVIHH